MKIAVLGSAPSSIRKAPFGDQEWQIWACSPAAYPQLPRVNAFFEIHRWEPGVIGKPETQKPWFSPEYVAWLKTVPPVVFVADPEAQKDIGQRALMLPWQILTEKYGSFFWTSTVAYMLAMAIEEVVAQRNYRKAHNEPEVKDVIGLWGVDMAANEELYSGQRSACQFFLQVMTGLKIDFYVPPESDLCTPPPMYGVSEVMPRAIKFLERQREFEQRIAQANASAEQFRNMSIFLQGALDDLKYHQTMWLHEGDAMAFDFPKVFPAIAAEEAGSRQVASLPQSAVPAPTEQVAQPAAAAAWSDTSAKKIHDPLADRAASSGSSAESA